MSLTTAFTALRKKGYFAKQNFWCCQTCAWAGVPNDKVDKAVFYHNQDNDRKRQGVSFHLGWSGDGKEICDTFKEHGVETDWDGDGNKRILVTKW